MPEVIETREKMLRFAADVREGRVRGALGQPMTDAGQYRHRRLGPRTGNG